MVQEDAMDALEGFREVVGFPLLVNFGNNGLRGYCSPKEAKQVGRNWSSRHIQGIAFDISSPDVDVGSLHEMALKFGFGGVGFYPKKNFIHVDIRTTPKTIRWEE